MIMLRKLVNTISLTYLCIGSLNCTCLLFLDAPFYGYVGYVWLCVKQADDGKV